MYYYGLLHMAEQKQDNQLKPTYSSSLRIQGVALRTCRKRWTIARKGQGYPCRWHNKMRWWIHYSKCPLLVRNETFLKEKIWRITNMNFSTILPKQTQTFYFRFNQCQFLKNRQIDLQVRHGILVTVLIIIK